MFDLNINQIPPGSPAQRFYVWPKGEDKDTGTVKNV